MEFCSKLMLKFLFWTVLMSSQVMAQSAAIQGIITDGDTPLELVTVGIQGTEKGVNTDATGFFKIDNLAAGSYKLAISSLGYKTQVKTINLADGEQKKLASITLKEDLLDMEEVVISGTMRESYISVSPIKVEVITSKYLEKTSMPTNLVESIALINGVQEVVACGVCYTNSISINGLPGAYTAILIDGSPLYGSLSSVYGLNGIPRQMIERIEVIKGPSSTLYGSEAMAGVINVITKDPSLSPKLSVDLMATSHMEVFGNITWAQKGKVANGFIGLNSAYINGYDDFNSDGFGDNINLDRYSFFTKWDFKRKSKKKLSVSAKVYYEDRRNGVESYIRDRAYQTLRGSDSIYGESIYTQRIELLGTYEFNKAKDAKLDFSFSHHLQDSYYGDAFYKANQQIGFLNFTKFKKWKNHEILLGAATKVQFYDDNTSATSSIATGKLKNNPERQFIPGVYVQDEWHLSEKWTQLAGIRLDHYGEHGLITSPRLSYKFKPGKSTTFRVNAGTGFRVVNLFTEDHAFVTGQREVIIQEDIKPEKSVNGSLNINHLFTLGESQGSFDVDVFYSYFTNKIIPDYEQKGKILYQNTKGFAQSAGLGISWNHSLKNGLSWNFGMTLQQSEEVEKNEFGGSNRQPIFYTSSWSANAVVNYSIKNTKFDLAYSASFYGPMFLPEVFDLNAEGQPLGMPRPGKSDPFALHNFQVNKKMKDGKWKAYFGVQNIFNYRQKYSPLVAFDDPNTNPGFSPFFDTAYAFSPIHGREWYVGLSFTLL